MGCVDSQLHENPASRSDQMRDQAKRRRVERKVNRLVTRYTVDEIQEVTDEQRRRGAIHVYTCPICTMRINKILACQRCKNCICLRCYRTYQQKCKNNFKCSFCGSKTSVFKDYQQQAHRYFDTTINGGFLSKEERMKADQEINGMGEGRSQLETIEELEVS